MKLTIQLNNDDLQQIKSLDINKIISDVLVNEKEEIYKLVNKKVIASVKKSISDSLGYDYYKKKLNNDQLNMNITEFIEEQVTKVFSDKEFMSNLEDEISTKVKNSLSKHYKRYL